MLVRKGSDMLGMVWDMLGWRGWDMVLGRGLRVGADSYLCACVCAYVCICNMRVTPYPYLCACTNVYQWCVRLCILVVLASHRNSRPILLCTVASIFTFREHVELQPNPRNSKITCPTELPCPYTKPLYHCASNDTPMTSVAIMFGGFRGLKP